MNRYWVVLLALMCLGAGLNYPVPDELSTSGCPNDPTQCSGYKVRQDINQAFTGILPITPNLGSGTLLNGVPLVVPPAGQIISVDTYNAKGDGATDDAASVQAAFTAACTVGGGVVKFTPNKTYFLNTPLLAGPSGLKGMIHFPCSNLRVEAYGAKIKVTTTNGTPTVVLGNVNANPESLTNAFAISSGAVAGSASVTLTTATNASNFSPGDPVLLQLNPFVALRYYTVDFVVSANATTGVIVLLNPLELTLSPNPVIADVRASWDHNIGWFGGEIDTSDDYAFSMFAHDGGTIQDVVINDTETSTNDVLSGSDVYSATINHIRLSVPCAGAIDLASRGLSRIRVLNSEVSETAIGGCSNNTVPLHMTGAGEGMRHLLFQGNTFTDATGIASVGSFETSTALLFDVQYLNNTFNFGTIQSSNLVGYSPVDFETGTTFINNHITMSAWPYAANLVNIRAAAPFIGNTVYDYNTAGGIAVYNAGGGVEANNTIIVNSSSVIGTVPAVGSAVTNNTITGPGTGTAISIADPGANSTVPVTIIGNVLTGWTTYLAAIPAHVLDYVIQGNNPNIPNQNAGVTNTFLPGVINGCKGDVTLSTGTGTFTNACVTTASACNAKDITTPANACTVAAPASGSIGLTGTGSDVCRTWCE